MQLNTLVKLQALGTERDEIGQPLPTGWADVADLWADIRYQTGMETVKAGAEASITRVSIRIRHRDDINAGMRVIHGGIIYNIKAVLPDVARKQHVDLVCEAVNA
ncbi:phage head closure protein [Noviherbaspirillum autotrophicum]|uniref:Head-tail adaptor protein n=1 Tax=Noviherbaspirillum autotrophicum TaxID=709839 RepID=A0A0C2BQK3_9BURK|nr:phage head closure protein [Noviherbaspirillum autotrophicum]KIF83565.1 hypothetical protein TSA66_08015 [Noviherbaspirillum autotrophicum]KIF83569.1 hypothetical protein TSA66_08260 [Noviherbaspirillum autotrophicum]KIF84063.1 hypothetical protein TSA66_00950 [Noviherbaspirillum autotrophicum]